MTFQGQHRERTFDNVKQFWLETAKTFKLDPQGTIRDRHFRTLEIEEICKVIQGKGKVLDVGCGQGYSTIYYSREVKEIIGVDYCEDFIVWARELLRQFPDPAVMIKNNITFQVADVRNLPFTNEEFDAIVCERVLINLPEKEMQWAAVQELSRVLKPGGLLACAEVTRQGHEQVNRFRTQFGLVPLEQYWHNLYINEAEFIPFVQQYFDLLAVKRFGMYHFISKVIHPLLVAPAEPRFDAKINEIALQIARKIPEFEDCGHQVMFVLKKK